MVGLLSNIAKSDQIKIKYMYLDVISGIGSMGAMGA